MLMEVIHEYKRCRFLRKGRIFYAIDPSSDILSDRTLTNPTLNWYYSISDEGISLSFNYVFRLTEHPTSPLVCQLRTRFSKPLRRAFTTQTARHTASTLSTSVTTMALVWRLQSPMTSPARTAFFPSALQLVLTFFFAFAHYMAMV
jgi:hypothetical protein